MPKHDIVKTVADTVGIAGSAGISIFTWDSVVSIIAGIVAIVWGVIRIYETTTVQSWINKRKK